MADEIVFRFDVTNPRAERLIGQRAGEQITAVTQAARDAAREIILDGYKKGKGPNDIALDVIGRINKATGQREGGVIGLTQAQTVAAINMRSRLLSGDPREMAKVLNMGLRDKRFDATIRKAIESGEQIDRNAVQTMYQRYVSNALRFRGEMVARTETGQAVLEASHEAFKQGLDKTGYTDKAVTKVWRTAHDKKVRDSHAALDGQKVKGLEGAFTSPESGARFLYPMDDSLGADAGEIINCRCIAEYNIDFAEGLVPDRDLNTPPPPPPPPPPSPSPSPSPGLQAPPIVAAPIPPPPEVSNPQFLKNRPSTWKTGLDVVDAFRARHRIKIVSETTEKTRNFPRFLEMAREADATLVRMTEEFPGFRDNAQISELRLSQGNYLSFSENGKTYKADGMYYPQERIIKLANMATPTAPLKYGEWTVSFSSQDGVLRHELGHALEKRLMKAANDAGVLHYETLTRLFLNAKPAVSELSKYGTSSAVEWFAESFSAWSHPDYGKDGHRINVILEKIFNLLLKKPEDR